MRPTSLFTTALVAFISIQPTFATPTSYTSRNSVNAISNEIAVETPVLTTRSVADILQAVAGLVQGIIGTYSSLAGKATYSPIIHVGNGLTDGIKRRN